MFSNVLKTLRKKAGYSQTELGKLLNLSKSTISMYELGERSPDHDTMALIAEIFNVSMDYLYEREEPTEPPLSENRQKLIDWARSVPEDKVEPVLQALQSILAIMQ